ncbi:hypothetical protein SLINC_5691 [Streptomyces lincolnensis]|uniref:Uncharacterized protein n=1 Tax=Streptomyces lincolnensis TaxID=1915 RepID=A0A1B1MH21_STRLN|nr:hypothetical protein SLINC_5691 [Streptomyces lincolnensis]AXG53880.1 hypothetical protein SLCG_2725 [Streptomyces lincolnensis]
MQIALICVVTLATLLATLQFSEASGTYQEAVRQDVRRQGAVLEDIRFVYGDEAPLAFEVAVAQARADALGPLRGDGRLAASEYRLAAQTAFGLRTAEGASPVLATDRYRHQRLGYDLPRRLSDVQRRSPELYALDPDATLRSGDRRVTWGLIAAGGAGATVLVAVLAAVVLRPRRWRRGTSGPPGGRVLRKLELLPQPATASAHRGTVTLHLAVSALLLLLPLGQVVAASVEQRAQAEAARKAVRTTTSIAAGGQRTAFLLAAQEEAVLGHLRATARELAALDTGTSAEDARHERTVAVTERGIATHIEKIAAHMGRLPGAEDDVDAAAMAALRSAPDDWGGLVDENLRQVDLAERASTRGTFLSGATALAVVSEMLAGMTVAALALGAGRRWVLWTAAGTAGSAALVFAALL